MHQTDVSFFVSCIFLDIRRLKACCICIFLYNSLAELITCNLKHIVYVRFCFMIQLSGRPGGPEISGLTRRNYFQSPEYFQNKSNFLILVGVLKRVQISSARSNLVPYAFIWGKAVRKSFNGRNLQQMTRVTNGLC